MITITGDDIKTATVIKANDYPEGPLFSFKSEVHEFGLDEDGDVVSVNIVADAAIEQAENRKLRKRLPRAAQICLRALHQALAEAGCPAPSSTTIPVGQRVVARSDWRRFAYRLGVSTSNGPRALQQAFNRGLDALLSEGYVGIWEDHVWLIS